MTGTDIEWIPTPRVDRKTPTGADRERLPRAPDAGARASGRACQSVDEASTAPKSHAGPHVAPCLSSITRRNTLMDAMPRLLLARHTGWASHAEPWPLLFRAAFSETATVTLCDDRNTLAED